MKKVVFLALLFLLAEVDNSRSHLFIQTMRIMYKLKILTLGII